MTEHDRVNIHTAVNRNRIIGASWLLKGEKATDGINWEKQKKRHGVKG